MYSAWVCPWSQPRDSSCYRMLQHCYYLELDEAGPLHPFPHSIGFPSAVKFNSRYLLSHIKICMTLDLRSRGPPLLCFSMIVKLLWAFCLHLCNYWLVRMTVMHRWSVHMYIPLIWTVHKAVLFIMGRRHTCGHFLCIYRCHPPKSVIETFEPS